MCPIACQAKSGLTSGHNHGNNAHKMGYHLYNYGILWPPVTGTVLPSSYGNMETTILFNGATYQNSVQYQLHNTSTTQSQIIFYV